MAWRLGHHHEISCNPEQSYGRGLAVNLGRVNMERCKTYGGEEKRTRERAPPKMFGPLQKSILPALSWNFCTGKTEHRHLRGLENVQCEGRVQNPFLGGVSFVRFSCPLFFPPPPSSKKYGSTPPICTAVRPPFVSPYFHLYCSTPPVCTAVRPPFVRQCFWKNTGGWGHWNVSHYGLGLASQLFEGATEPLRPDDPHPHTPLTPTRFGPSL